MQFSQLLRLLVYGFTTYAATFMLWALFAAYALARGPAPRITAWTATAMVVFYAAQLLKPESFNKALGIGVVWLIIHVSLDVLYVIPAAGILAFNTYYVWVSYAIVFVTPVVVFLINRLHSIARETLSVSAQAPTQ